MTADSVKRRPVFASILSGVFPGLGQFYNRQPIKGALFLVAGVVLSWLVARTIPIDVQALARQGATFTGTAGGLLVAVSLGSIVDAARVAGGRRAGSIGAFRQ